LAGEARAAIDLWREALPQFTALRSLETRIAAIERDEAVFVGRVGELLAGAGDSVSDGDAFAAVRRLRLRLDQAKLARSKADTADEALVVHARAASIRGCGRACSALKRDWPSCWPSQIVRAQRRCRHC
jgi:hypothetical protein